MAYEIDGNDIIIKMADTALIPFEFIIEDETVCPATEEPLNLEGATIYFTAKKYVSDSYDKAVIKKEITQHDNAANGQTTISLTKTDTNIPPGKYPFDIKIKTSDEDEDTVMLADYARSGYLHIKESATGTHD